MKQGKEKCSRRSKNTGPRTMADSRWPRSQMGSRYSRCCCLVLTFHLLSWQHVHAYSLLANDLALTAPKVDNYLAAIYYLTSIRSIIAPLLQRVIRRLHDINSSLLRCCNTFALRHGKRRQKDEEVRVDCCLIGPFLFFSFLFSSLVPL